jgi:hypothetical protein
LKINKRISPIERLLGIQQEPIDYFMVNTNIRVFFSCKLDIVGFVFKTYWTRNSQIVIKPHFFNIKLYMFESQNSYFHFIYMTFVNWTNHYMLKKENLWKYKNKEPLRLDKVWNLSANGIDYNYGLTSCSKVKIPTFISSKLWCVVTK